MRSSGICQPSPSKFATADRNYIDPWNYAQLPAVLGGGTGYEVRTEGGFDAAVRAARANSTALSLIHVHLAEDDFSQPLERLAERLRSCV